ncbi:hypothetical protein CspHIS471_0605640 [Cutaneotrichosporon sp. HIS471]|nr:hypothetical protein CspHIS471_0605640 [Cutaneotrichosporon sp. HIS471]
MLAKALVALFAAAAVIAVPADKAAPFLAKRGTPALPPPPPANPNWPLAPLAPAVPTHPPLLLPLPLPLPALTRAAATASLPALSAAGRTFCPSNCECSTSGEGEHLINICIAALGLDIDIL